MPLIKKIDKFSVLLLTKDIAKEHINLLIELVNQIPLVNYTKKDILAENKDDRIFHSKWKHSLILFDDKKPIGVIIGYERKKEENKQYPQNSIYISELGIHPDYQKRGLGKKLLKTFLEYNQKIGFMNLKGNLSFSIQTNSANWNKHVIDLYQTFGFKQTSLKQYDNRIDYVLFSN
jgi:ribosomal protein S18 acetylase RimI-like enzyme